MIRRPPKSTLFPYPPLSRSQPPHMPQASDSPARSCATTPAAASKCTSALFRISADVHFEAADRKSTRLNSSHDQISYAVFCLKKKKKQIKTDPDPKSTITPT